MKQTKAFSLFLCGLLTALVVVGFPLLSQSQGIQYPYEADLITYQKDTGQAVFNWDQFTIGSAPPFSEEGSNGTSAWGVGTPPKEALTAGNLSQWGAGELSINDISNITGDDLSKLALTAYPHLTNATVDELVNTLGLSNYAPKEIKPFLALAEKVGGQYAKNYLNKTIGQWLGDNPEFGSYSLNSLEAKALENFDLESIPGAEYAELQQFAGWSDLRIEDIPGLVDVPFSSFPEFTGPAVVPVARVGVIHDKNESNSTIHVISGGGEAGYNIPCTQANCSYIELDPVAGDRKGQRWNVGGNNKKKGEQKVKGGFGANPGLRAINAGYEPVGRPLGDDMQLVITKVNQSQGSLDLALYSRACETNPITGKTCSARALGPIPVGTFHETDQIPLGLGKYAPPSYQASADIPRPRAKENGGASNDIEKQIEELGIDGAKIASSKATGCRESLNKLSHPDKQLYGYIAIPHILRYSKGYQLSPSQTAFMLAYFESRGYLDDFKAGIQKLYPSLKKSINSSNADYYGLAKGLRSSNPSATANKASQFNKVLSECNSGSGSCSLSSRLVRPVKVSRGNRVFGMRWHPIFQENRLHAGIDYPAPIGTPVYAQDCGQVAFAGVNGTMTSGYGLTIDIQHGNSYSTRYAHLSKLSVKRKQWVTQGQIIAYVGSSGGSTGPHLHHEVRKNGSPVNPDSVSSFR